MHHLTIDVLQAGLFSLKKAAAPGVDGVVWEDYAEDLENNLEGLHARVRTGAYRASFFPPPIHSEGGGRLRPLGIAALEDKIVQAAAVAVPTPI